MESAFCLPRSRLTPWLAAFVLSFALLPIPTHAQGCAQCRDNTAATSPATQRAYRRAIILMSSAAAGVFAATLAIAHRNR
jgi:hypothetical protein